MTTGEVLRSVLLILLTILLSLLIGETVYGQTYNPFNERDNTYTLLGLKRAKQAYETAQSEYERQKKLFDDGLISQNEFDKAHNVFTDAEVNYQQSLLAVIFEEQYITVSRAVKYQGTDGSKRVRLTMSNTSGGSAELKKLAGVEDELFRALQPDVIPNVYVSILNDENAIISQPYEQKINELSFGDPIVLDFGLLQDLDEVSVFMIYGNGNQRTMKIFLQKDESVDRVLVQSEQFSQEVDLGSSSSFDLSLELFSGSSNMFGLEVVNLPQQIGRFFKDPAGQVRLTQVKFTESSRSKKAALEVTLPDRPSDAIKLDQPISFYVLIVPPDQLDDVRARSNDTWTETQIEALNVGYVRLELVPRGRGELLVRIPQLFKSIEATEVAQATMELVNEGSHRLDNIEVDVDLPLNWRRTLAPDHIRSIEIGGDDRIELSFEPPDDVAPGKYNIRVRTSALSNGEPVTAEDKTITVEIQSETSLFGTGAILLLLIVLVVGVVVYGVRLSRR